MLPSTRRSDTKRKGLASVNPMWALRRPVLTVAVSYAGPKSTESGNTP